MKAASRSVALSSLRTAPTSPEKTTSFQNVSFLEVGERRSTCRQHVVLISIKREAQTQPKIEYIVTKQHEDAVAAMGTVVYANEHVGNRCCS